MWSGRGEHQLPLVFWLADDLQFSVSGSMCVLEFSRAGCSVFEVCSQPTFLLESKKA